MGLSDPVLLPDEITEKLRAGELLSSVIQSYLSSKGQEVSTRDIQVNGTAFYVTKEKISRKSMITQALQRAMERLDKQLGARSA